ncbi:hypothetical protein [Dysosmobacter sp.]|uniref:hypothetical protein n=1 Tax=Dysosmobacter sp. TaxID=2591382 RepID=UPI002A8760A9|nr:hypothetical protein [Dysosmobacter sp.]MDY3281637.1 hypothetical protein [Dysosmobacter sp.]
MPDLERLVSRQREWRAVIVCDEEGLHHRNPFDLVPVKLPERPRYAEDLEAYLQEVRRIKTRAYDQAAGKPLVRLVTRLCEPPLAVPGKNHLAKADPEFEEYQFESDYKNRLRQKITGDEKLSVFYPAEILCLAKRTHEEEAHAIETAWATYDEYQYRRFYDWNLYFDKMRYAVYDILPRGHKDYLSEYLKFLTVLMLLAGNEMPADSLRPNRVYLLQGESEDDALRRLLRQYDEKLCATDAYLETQVKRVLSKKARPLSDAEVEMNFCGNVNVPVTLDPAVDLTGLFASTDELGLATDMPQEESRVWAREYKNSVKARRRLIKQVPRSLRRAGDSLRSVAARGNLEDVELTGFQTEDIEENIHNQEMQMVRLANTNPFRPDECRRELEQAAAAVSGKIETRMTRRQILFFSILTAVLLMIAFLPFFIGNIRAGGQRQIMTALTLLIGTFAVMGAVGFTALVCLRRGLKNTIGDYNEAVNGVESRVYEAMNQYSAYLSHLGGAMRGFDAVDYFSRHNPADTQQVRIYRKHQADILRQRQQLRELFERYLPSELNIPFGDVEPYAFDFDVPRDYDYPIPLHREQLHEIEFLERGNLVEVGATFLKRVGVRLEEYYD